MTPKTRNVLYLLPEADGTSLYFAPIISIIDEVKKIKGIRYDILESRWFVPQSSSFELKAFLDDAILRGLIDDVVYISNKEERGDQNAFLQDLEIPDTFQIRPYPYQMQGIRYMLEHKRTFNCDDMGLGKTLQSVVAVCMAKAFPCLVVCPSCMKLTWQREFRVIANKSATILSDENRLTWQELFLSGQSSVFIVNYESLKKFFVKGIRGFRTTTNNIVLDERVGLFKSVIIDECHRCKERTTLWSQYLEAITRGKEYVFMLTGTPIVTHIRDMMQQLAIMHRLDDFGGKEKFIATFGNNGLPTDELCKLNAILWRTCYLRRDKSMVLKELPPKTRAFRYVILDNMEQYEKAEKDIIAYIRTLKKAYTQSNADDAKAKALMQIGLLRQLCAEGKLNDVCSMVDDILMSGQKLIVFCAHKSTVKYLHNKFKQSVKVTGDEDAYDKQKSVDKFQKDPACNLIILNIKSGGVGITLTAASNILFAELPWTASDCDQCECRAHRNGQNLPVTCTYLVARGTFDEKMVEIIDGERLLSDAVTGSKSMSVNEVILNYANNKFAKLTKHTRA